MGTAGRTLWIGRVAFECYKKDGESDVYYPGGSAYNIARWMASFGHSAELAAVLGADFPSDSRVDDASSVRSPDPTPVVEFHVGEEGVERRTMKSDYKLASISVNAASYDIVGLVSIEPEFLTAFEDATASVKMFDPGDMLENYSRDRLVSGAESATHVILSQHERRAAQEYLPCSIEQLPLEFDLDEVILTSEREIEVHSPEGQSRFDVETVETPTDTVGAGDAFAAGYLAGELADVPRTDRVVFGRILARNTIRHYGSLPMTVPELELVRSEGQRNEQ